MKTINPLSSAPGFVVALTLFLGMVHAPVVAAQTVEDKVQELTQHVTQLTALIAELRLEMSRSREETRELRLELRRSRETGEQGSAESSEAPSVVNPQQGVIPPVESNLRPEDRLALLEENLRLLSDRQEEQHQTKVESASRYRTKFSGVVLLNAFSNRGRVENVEVPGIALRRGQSAGEGTLGVTGLQSQLGFETYGPEWAGGRVSAGLQFDFSGESSSSFHAASWGAVRLRTAAVRMDWDRTSVIVGQDAPLISPLSPTSVASLAYPALFYSGNLWTWIPQARVDHRMMVSERSTISVQGGIFDPASRGSKMPGYGTRIAFSHGDSDRPMTFGINGYYGRQNRGAGHTIDGWAGTADWTVPLGSRFDVSGEFYRGRAIGNLGAVQGRSVVSNGPESDPASSMIGLNSVGGWTQLRFKATGSVEMHAAHGEEHAFGRDLLRFTPAGTTNSAISKNRTEMFNVIYRPRTDLLFSLEYRRFKTSRATATGDTADHLNLGIGVLF